MAQEKVPTPEKQLLKLIEGSASRGSLKAAAIKHQSLSLLSLGAWQGRFSFFKKKISSGFKEGGWKKIDIRVLNNTLFLLIFLLVIYFGISFYFYLKYLKTAPNLKFKDQEEIKPAVIQEASILKVLSYYLEKARARDIFKIGAQKNEESAQRPDSGTATSALAEATSDLKLVGISWSNDPDVMIENTKTQRTYFLKKGQAIEPFGVKIEAVFKDKIILSYQGKEIELR